MGSRDGQRARFLARSAARARTSDAHAELLSAPHGFFSKLLRRASRPPRGGQKRVSDAASSVDAGLDSVTRALNADDVSVRMLAVEVIVGYSDERAAGMLATVVHDPDPAVRRAAIAAAVRMGSKRTVSSLILALDDSESSVRDAAREAIEEITGEAVAPADVQDPQQRAEKIEQLRSWWKRERLSQLAAEFGLSPPYE